MAITPDQFDSVIRCILDGMALEKALQNQGVSRWGFMKALALNPNYQQEYDRARELRTEFTADEVVEIADTERDAQIGRNRIDARKWHASKMHPKKFGERIDLNVNQTVGLGLALAEAKKRAELVDQRSRDEVIDVSNDVVPTLLGEIAKPSS